MRLPHPRPQISQLDGSPIIFRSRWEGNKETALSVGRPSRCVVRNTDETNVAEKRRAKVGTQKKARGSVGETIKGWPGRKTERDNSSYRSKEQSSPRRRYE